MILFICGFRFNWLTLCIEILPFVIYDIRLKYYTSILFCAQFWVYCILYIVIKRYLVGTNLSGTSCAILHVRTYGVFTRKSEDFTVRFRQTLWSCATEYVWSEIIISVCNAQNRFYYRNKNKDWMDKTENSFQVVWILA